MLQGKDIIALRPEITQVSIIYAVGLLVAAGIADAAIYMFLPSGLLGAYQMGLFYAIPLVFLFLIAIAVGKLAYLRYTQYDSIGPDFVEIMEGLVTQIRMKIPSSNIDDVESVVPLITRFLGLGHIIITTNDQETHILYFVKKPGDLVERMQAGIHMPQEPKTTGQAPQSAAHN
jgi:membrane protein YdbS with pleckstrin-like domain